MTFLLLIFLLNLSDTIIDAPFLIASETNELPSLFFPFIAKKISFFLIFFELMEALFNLVK